MEALASRRAPSQEEQSAKILAELAEIASKYDDPDLVQALRDGAAALNLEAIRDARG